MAPKKESKDTTKSPSKGSRATFAPDAPDAMKDESAVNRTYFLFGVTLLCVLIIVAVYFQSGSTKAGSSQRALVIIVEGLTTDTVVASSTAGLTPNLDILGVQGTATVRASGNGNPNSRDITSATDSSASQLGSLLSILAGTYESNIPIISPSINGNVGTGGLAAAAVGPRVTGKWTSFLGSAFSVGKWVSIVGSGPLIGDGDICGAVDYECLSLTTVPVCDATAYRTVKSVQTLAQQANGTLSPNPNTVGTCNANVRYFMPSGANDADWTNAVAAAMAKSDLVVAFTDSLKQAQAVALTTLADSPDTSTNVPSLFDGLVESAMFVADAMIGRVLMLIADRAAERFENWMVIVVGTAPFTTRTSSSTGSSLLPVNSLWMYGAPQPSPARGPNSVYMGLTTFQGGAAVPGLSSFSSNATSTIDVAPTVLKWLGVAPPASITGTARV